MARVFGFLTEGGPCPADLEAARAVDQFGAPSVFGRVLTRKEARRLNLARSIDAAYTFKMRSARIKDYGMDKWAEDNPESDDLLTDALLAWRMTLDIQN